MKVIIMANSLSALASASIAITSKPNTVLLWVAVAAASVTCLSLAIFLWREAA